MKQSVHRGALVRSLVILPALVCPLLPRSAAAATYIVATTGTDQAGCGGATSPCQTIAFALAAATGPGDVIEVSAGTHVLTDEILVAKSGAQGDPLIIRGEDMSSTVLDGTGLGMNRAVMSVQGAFVVVEELMLANSTDPPLVVTGADVTVRRVHASHSISNNSACMLFNGASRPLVEDVLVTACAKQGVMFQASSGVRLLGAEAVNPGGTGIHVTGADTVVIRGATVTGAGASLLNAASIFLNNNQQVEVGAREFAGSVSPTRVVGGSSTGIEVKDSAAVTISNTYVSSADGNIAVLLNSLGVAVDLHLEHVTLVGASNAPALTDSGVDTRITVKNSILAFNPAGDLPTLLSDLSHSYNLRHQNGGANVALGAGELDADPLFADLAGEDVHLRSAFGRFDPASGWVNDAVSSRAIDLADPASPHVNEPGPNGGRANAGVYGNTAEASRSSSSTASDAALPDVWTPLPDAAGPDTARPDASDLDSAMPDATGPDAAGPDAGQADAARPDSGQPDSAAADGASADRAQVDSATVDAMSAVAVIARAGEDSEVTVPHEITLDGTSSQAPTGANFVWTLADGPQGPARSPIGESATATFLIQQEGIWLFNLVVSADGISDSDQVAITASAGDNAAATACGCDGIDRSQQGAATYTALLLAWLLLVLRRRRPNASR